MPIRIRVRDARPADLLAIYVRDHLAGAAGGVALFQRASRTTRQPDHRRALTRLARDVAADVVALRRCATALGIQRPRGREVLARGVERVGRLKLNGQLLESSPLSPLVEVEALILGVTGKASCWRVLGTSGLQRRLPDDVDLESLERRALGQREDLLQIRDQLAATAFGQPSSAGVAHATLPDHAEGHRSP